MPVGFNVRKGIEMLDDSKKGLLKDFLEGFCAIVNPPFPDDSRTLEICYQDVVAFAFRIRENRRERKLVNGRDVFELLPENRQVRSGVSHKSTIWKYGAKDALIRLHAIRYWQLTGKLLWESHPYLTGDCVYNGFDSRSKRINEVVTTNRKGQNRFIPIGLGLKEVMRSVPNELSKGVIYSYIGVNGGSELFVKIGYTGEDHLGDYYNKLRNSHNPIHLGALPGNKEHELGFHSVFGGGVKGREWYAPDVSFLLWIRRNFLTTPLFDEIVLQYLGFDLPSVEVRR